MEKYYDRSFLDELSAGKHTPESLAPECVFAIGSGETPISPLPPFLAEEQYRLRAAAYYIEEDPDGKIQWGTTCYKKTDTPSGIITLSAALSEKEGKGVSFTEWGVYRNGTLIYLWQHLPFIKDEYSTYTVRAIFDYRRPS